MRDLGKVASVAITQNDEAKSVPQSIHGREQTQELPALLKILSLGQDQIARGRVKPLADVIRWIKFRRRSAE